MTQLHGQWHDSTPHVCLFHCACVRACLRARLCARSDWWSKIADTILLCVCRLLFVCTCVRFRVFALVFVICAEESVTSLDIEPTSSDTPVFATADKRVIVVSRKGQDVPAKKVWPSFSVRSWASASLQILQGHKRCKEGAAFRQQSQSFHERKSRSFSKDQSWSFQRMRSQSFPHLPGHIFHCNFLTSKSAASRIGSIFIFPASHWAKTSAQDCWLSKSAASSIG